MTSTPTRVDSDLFAAAQASAALHSRSAAQQINHWARIGRELESSTSTSARAIERVLAGTLPYDDIPAPQQAIVRAEWAEQITTTISDLNFAEEFTAAGESWTDADADGNPVVRNADAQ